MGLFYEQIHIRESEKTHFTAVTANFGFGSCVLKYLNPLIAVTIFAFAVDLIRNASYGTPLSLTHDSPADDRRTVQYARSLIIVQLNQVFFVLTFRADMDIGF